MFYFKQKLENVKFKLESINAIKIIKYSVKSVCTKNSIDVLEKRIGCMLPDTLRNVFMYETGGVEFFWENILNQFGDNCSNGYMYLLSIDEIISLYNDQVEQVNEAMLEALEQEIGYKDLIRDWPYWIPLFRFPNGDCFCFDIKKKNIDYPIVFLEHDVMDVGPNLHGIVIANNFKELIEKWSELLFVDIYDWTDGINENGINPDAEIFKKLRKYNS